MDEAPDDQIQKVIEQIEALEQKAGEDKPPFVVFCTPALSKQFSVEYMMSALATQHLCYASGIQQIWRMVGGDPYLAKVRSRMASEFLRFPEATDLFFLDDDMGWPAEKVVEFIRRPEAVLVGAYPQKQDEVQYPIELSSNNGELIYNGGLVMTHLAPTGFMRLKRHVIEQMAATSGRYVVDDAEAGPVECFDIFKMGFIEAPDKPGHGKWWGEDFYFSARWRSMGGEIWCDPNIPFTHRGGKVWKGTFADQIAAVMQSRKEAA